LEKLSTEKHPNTAETTALLRSHQVAEMIGMKRSWIYDAMKRGEFPNQIRIGKRAVGWRRDDVLAWIDAREAAAQEEAERARSCENRHPMEYWR